jgi:hypothetical protein
LKLLLEVLDRELGVEEPEPVAQLLERTEGLVHVAVRHEEETVVEGQEVLEKVEILGEPLVPARVTEIQP